MNFSLTFIAQNAFDGKTDNGYLTNIFEDIAQDFIYPDPYHLLTFLDNHDLSRWCNVSLTPGWKKAIPRRKQFKYSINQSSDYEEQS